MKTTIYIKKENKAIQITDTSIIIDDGSGILISIKLSVFFKLFDRYTDTGKEVMKLIIEKEKNEI